MTTKQVFKNQQLTRVKVRNNILKVYELANQEDKYDWYKEEAFRFAADLSVKYEVNLNKVCGYLAALSPMKNWTANKNLVVQYLTTGEAGHIKANVAKCHKIRESNGSDEAILKILNGRKTSNFYLNIRYFDKALTLTIDRHAVSVALGRWISEQDYSGMTAKQYEFLSQCYRWTAAQLGINPLILQSSTWLVFRRIKKDIGR